MAHPLQSQLPPGFPYKQQMLLSASPTRVTSWRSSRVKTLQHSTTFQGIVSCLTHLICHSIALWVWVRHRTRIPFNHGVGVKVSELLSHSDFQGVICYFTPENYDNITKQFLMLLLHMKSTSPQEGSATRCCFDLTCAQERWKWVQCIISARFCAWQNLLIAHGNQCRAV